MIMSGSKTHTRTRAQESSAAIERLYITMRHLFNRGFYKPMGVSGETLTSSKGPILASFQSSALPLILSRGSNHVIPKYIEINTNSTFTNWTPCLSLTQASNTGSTY